MIMAIVTAALIRYVFMFAILQKKVKGQLASANYPAA
jgi:hypothetical protein